MSTVEGVAPEVILGDTLIRVIVEVVPAGSREVDTGTVLIPINTLLLRTHGFYLEEPLVTKTPTKKQMTSLSENCGIRLQRGKG